MKYSVFRKFNRDDLRAGFLISPAFFWLVVFFLIPLCILFVYSFCQKGIYGGVTWNFTLDNYRNVINPVYLKIVVYSFWIAFLNTVICLIIGYPMAYYISTRKSARLKNTLVLLVILPFWTNFLVRTYSWMILLRDSGLINTMLLNAGFIDEPLKLLFTKTAVIIGLVYGYLPFMVLPLYASIEKIDPSLMEAAHDLGANSFKAFLKVMLPLTVPGIVAGCILVFVPTLGAYITPDLLGGAKDMMIGNLIQMQFLKSKNWPFGSSISFIVMIIVLALLVLYIKFGDLEEEGK
jgi:spermidine/putrescine transport system permease protein